MAVLTGNRAVGYGRNVPKDLAAYADLDLLIQLWAILREHVGEPDAQGNVRITVSAAGVSDLIAQLDPLVPAKVSANRRPPAQLAVLVLVWLVLVAGPVAEVKLPPEIQTMLGTEVGTVALALTITQIMNQKRK
jgi:hypothetical protein